MKNSDKKKRTENAKVCDKLFEASAVLRNKSKESVEKLEALKRETEKFLYPDGKPSKS